jgi:peroxiredoxin
VHITTTPQSVSSTAASTKARTCAGPSLAASLILLLTYAYPQSDLRAKDTTPSSSDHEKQLAALESSWAHLAEIKATEDIDRLLMDNYFSVDAQGTVSDRGSYLSDLKSGKLQLESWTIEDSTIRLVGATAVVSATVGIIGEYQQRDLNGFYQVTDTLVRQKDGWRVLSRQQTRISSRTDPLFERVGKPNGKPRIVLFVQGSFCPECMAQLLAFAKEAGRMKYQITVVSADTEEDLKRFPDVPFKLVADPQHRLFRRFGAFQNKPLHGTFALDGKGSVVFGTTGYTPFMQADVIQLWFNKATK